MFPRPEVCGLEAANDIKACTALFRSVKDPTNSAPACLDVCFLKELEDQRPIRSTFSRNLFIY